MCGKCVRVWGKVRGSVGEGVGKCVKEWRSVGGGAGVGEVLGKVWKSVLGLGSRIVTLNPLTPNVFQAADTYCTSHVLRQIVFVSNRPCVKSSSRQVARVKFLHVKLSCTLPQHTSPHPNTLFHTPYTFPHICPYLPHTPTHFSTSPPTLPYTFPHLPPHLKTLSHIPHSSPHIFPYLSHTPTHFPHTSPNIFPRLPQHFPTPLTPLPTSLLTFPTPPNQGWEKSIFNCNILYFLFIECTGALTF